MAPAPPSPALACSCASSTNPDMWLTSLRAARQRPAAELRNAVGDDPFVAPLHQRPAEHGAGPEHRVADLDHPDQSDRRPGVGRFDLQPGRALDVAGHGRLDQPGRLQRLYGHVEPQRVGQRRPHFAVGAPAGDQPVALEPAQPGPPTGIVLRTRQCLPQLGGRHREGPAAVEPEGVPTQLVVGGSTSTSLRPLREPNFTLPGAVANRVSSPPRPTFSPGWNLVPRWRTMMAPASTSVPSKTFTPSRWAAESRPLRVEPPPLVLDMSAVALRDSGDLDRRVLLAVAPVAAAVGLVLVGEAPDLRALLLAHDAGRHAGPGQIAGGRGDRFAIDQQDRREAQVTLLRRRDALDRQPFALGHLVLLSTCPDHCVHESNMLANFSDLPRPDRGGSEKNGVRAVLRPG